MKTLLVDDHALFLEALRSFLTTNGFEVVGTARNGATALLKFEMLRPDLVLMDLQMPGCDGIQTTQAIKKQYPDAKIVMLTALEDEENLFLAIQAGADGYLLKDMEPKSFFRQLVGLTEGETPLAPSLAGRILHEFRHHRAKSDKDADLPQRGLTERQSEILQMIIQGLLYKEIAAHMNLKEVTVKYHVREILDKLQLANRSQLIAHASRYGLGRDA